MDNVLERIKYITDASLGDKETRDRLLMLDAENVDLGRGHTEEEEMQMRSNSSIIVDAIEPYCYSTYIMLKRGLDS